MSVRNSVANALPLARVIGANPRMLGLNPAILWFLSDYMGKFRLKQVGDHLILHSHLPPLNSRAYTRFVNDHLLSGSTGPTHAQIGITNACPQRCDYCYNRNRKGQPMERETVLRTVRELREMGVVWLGLTGGEPLLSPDIVRIIESVAEDCAVKLFTTGCGLTGEKASQLQQAGLFSVSVSLDHWLEAEHDRHRRHEGAFRQALQAIDTFLSVGGIHVGVSAVLSREMLEHNEVEHYLSFLEGLGVHEAWLSGVKPTVEAFWSDDLIVTEEYRLKLVALQDRWNARGKMTVNYLGHFEGKECFGCNAGNKMVYVDAFGEVSPCVFTPLSFGNVQTTSLRTIFAEMRQHFPSEADCFINKNYRLLQKHSAGEATLRREDTLALLQEVEFGGLSRFNRLYYGTGAGRAASAASVEHKEE
jgi:MoaA/NifB/PqqE/SkfB family radical SAM enzyme